MKKISRRRLIQGAAISLVPAGLGGAWLIDSRRTDDPLVAESLRSAALESTSMPQQWVIDENQLPGTKDWLIPDEAVGSTVGFADMTSAQVGDTVTLFVSTETDSFRVEAYRMGYYQNLNGRLVWSSQERPGVVQAEPKIDRATNTVVAPWDPSIRIDIDENWPVGSYLIKLVGSNGEQHYVPLTVRDDANNAAIAIVNANSTWQAYNYWGGHSLYPPNGTSRKHRPRADVVSFDRPYDGNGSKDFLGIELPLIALAEANGLDVTYLTDIDLHQRPELVANNEAIISLGHDEYYSTPMRRALETSRDSGINIAFLGANAVYRHVRFEPSDIGDDRLMVNYRSTSDPIMKTDPTMATVQWRSAPLNRPEKDLIGIQYEAAGIRDDMVIVDPDAWMFEGTGLSVGDRLTTAVGGEYDRYFAGPGTPDNLQILAHSPIKETGVPADMAYYTSESGAGVFATGSVAWIDTFDGRWLEGPGDRSAEQAKRITVNVLRAFADGPAGLVHPAEPNVSEIY